MFGTSKTLFICIPPFRRAAPKTVPPIGPETPASVKRFTATRRPTDRSVDCWAVSCVPDRRYLGTICRRSRRRQRPAGRSYSRAASPTVVIVGHRAGGVGELARDRGHSTGRAGRREYSAQWPIPWRYRRGRATASDLRDHAAPSGAGFERTAVAIHPTLEVPRVDVESYGAALGAPPGIDLRRSRR